MAEENSKKDSKTIIIIIIALVLILVLGGGTFLFFMSGDENLQNNTQTTQTMQNIPTTQNNQSPTSASYIRIGSVYQLDQFIVNLLTQSGRRYLKTTIGLEMTNPELRNELDAKRGPIRDTINSILSSKSYEEISTPRGKEKLKEEIANRLNEWLVDGKIRNVFLVDFVVQ